MIIEKVEDKVEKDTLWTTHDENCTKELCTTSFDGSNALHEEWDEIQSHPKTSEMSDVENDLNQDTNKNQLPNYSIETLEQLSEIFLITKPPHKAIPRRHEKRKKLFEGMRHQVNKTKKNS